MKCLSIIFNVKYLRRSFIGQRKQMKQVSSNKIFTTHSVCGNTYVRMWYLWCYVFHIHFMLEVSKHYFDALQNQVHPGPR